jgi:hypothetical protein
MQVGDIQDEVSDESQDEAMPEDQELSYQESMISLLSVLKSIFFLQNRRIK